MELLTLLFTFVVVLLGCFTQSLTGFGVGLITMALLPSLIGLQVATPLVALVGFLLEGVMLIRYLSSVKFKSIIGLLIASVMAIPFGVIYLRRLDENIALFLLGLVITLYAVYALFGFRLPQLIHPAWPWIFGFVGGLLSGAYNTSGPPVVVYGNSQRWSPTEFKSNLAGFFLVGSVIVISTHWVRGNLTSDVWQYFWVTLPALILGFILGQKMDRLLNPELFRKIILTLLILLGVRLML